MKSRKFFKTTGKHSLAECDSFWGEKQFLLIFGPFYRFDQNQLFKQIQIFFRISPFSNLLRKTNFLSISVLLAEIVTFLMKKSCFQWIRPKMLQKAENHSLALCGSPWGEQQFLLIFVTIICLFKKSCLNKSKFSSWFASFQTC